MFVNDMILIDITEISYFNILYNLYNYYYNYQEYFIWPNEKAILEELVFQFTAAVNMLC